MHLKKRITLGLAAVVVVVFGIYLATRNNEAVSPKTEAERRKQLAVQDLDTLKNTNTNARDYATSLLRLSTQGNPLAKEKALEWSKSSNKESRLVAAEALGIIFDTEAQAILKKWIDNEKDEALLSKVAKGLSYKQSPERLEWLKRLAGKISSSSEARLETLSGIIKISSDSSEKTTYVSELIKMARNSKNPQLASKAYTRAMGLGPRNPELVKLIHERLYSSKDEQERAMSLRHLVLIKDPKSLEAFMKFSKDPSPQLRRAALQILPNVCPEKRWPLLNDMIKTERDRGVVGVVIDLPKLLNEENSISTYNDWLKLDDLNENEKNSIRANIKELESKSQQFSPCTDKTL